jgi:hypothetical protein
MIVANTVTADTTGNIFLPVDSQIPNGPVSIISAAAVTLQGVKGAAAPGGYTLPANVPVLLSIGADKVYLKTGAGTAAVSYLYSSN